MYANMHSKFRYLNFCTISDTRDVKVSNRAHNPTLFNIISPNNRLTCGRGHNMKRASLMAKAADKKHTIVQIGDEEDALEGFTKRVLLSLVVDITELRETAERLQIQVFTLAKAHGISTKV